MSLVLDGATQYGYCNSVNLVYPFTIAGWFKSDSIAVSQMIASLEVTASSDYNVLQAAGAETGDPVRAMTYATTWAVAATTSGYSAATWTHCGGVFTAPGNRSAFLNGGSKGTNTTSQSVAGTNLGIGAYKITVPALFFDGKLAYIGIWDIALSDANMVTLAGGANPTTVEPDHLVHLYTLFANGNDSVGTAHLTLVGTPSFDGSDDPEVDSVVEAEATITGVGSISATGEVLEAINAAATVTGTGSISAYAIANMLNITHHMCLVAAGNDEIWYEDV
jgi:hypothetical protein